MKNNKPIVIVFLLGLAAGILLPNMLPGSGVRMNALSDILLLQRYLEEPLSGRDYFLYLLRKRGSGYVLGVLFGISIFGVPMSLAWMGALGFFVGFLLTSTLLAGGLSGFILGIGLLLPQYFLYIPVSVMLFGICFHMSAGCWKNRTYGFRDYRRYFFRVFLLLLLIVAGFVLEGYANPLFVKSLMEWLKLVP